MMMSLSARRAWIEISYNAYLEESESSLSARRAWIEMPRNHRVRRWPIRSLSARRAWIEMPGFWRITPEK